LDSSVCRLVTVPCPEEYYRTQVIGGPRAFVMVAGGYAEFVETVCCK
jgi:hypothetical protein